MLSSCSKTRYEDYYSFNNNGCNTDTIINFKYECESCIYCQASVSLLSRNAKNKSIEKVKNFAKQAKNCFERNSESFDKEWKEFDKIMNKNNISRKECLLLPINTTLDALDKKSL